MRNATCCLLVILLGSWSSTVGQSAPRFTSPRIVATFERLGVTGTISPTTIYTPEKWGTFRISIVMVGTVPNGQYNYYWQGGVQFTDAAGENLPSQAAFAAELNTRTRSSAVAEFPIRAKAGKPIKFSVTAPMGGTDGTKYNVWVVVEQLM